MFLCAMLYLLRLSYDVAGGNIEEIRRSWSLAYVMHATKLLVASSSSSSSSL
jgi:hypothetical protein